MTKEEINKKQNEAWDLLINKGLTLGQRVAVRSAFVSTYMNEIPHVEIEYEGGNVKYYRSTHDGIKVMLFETENEVYLANAMYVNKGDNFNPNDFVHEFKMVLRMLGVKSKWSE